MSNYYYRQSSYAAKILLVYLICLLIIILSSCKTPYDIISHRTGLSPKEKVQLASACEREFPVIQTSYNIDSVIKSTQKDYTKKIDSLVNVSEILDSIIHDQIPIIDTTFIDSSNCIPRFKVAYAQIEKLESQRNSLITSLNLLKSQIQSLKKEYQPCDSLRIATQVTEGRGSAKNYLIAASLRAYQDSTLIMTTKYNDARQTAKTRLFWIIGLAVALGIGLFFKIRSLFKPKLI